VYMARWQIQSAIQCMQKRNEPHATAWITQLDSYRTAWLSIPMSRVEFVGTTRTIWKLTWLLVSGQLAALMCLVETYDGA
jgi:hypothetical protein